MKTLKKQKVNKVAGVSQIDNTWQEVNLSSFLKDRPNLISDLKKKYAL